MRLILLFFNWWPYLQMIRSIFILFDCILQGLYNLARLAICFHAPRCVFLLKAIGRRVWSKLYKSWSSPHSKKKKKKQEPVFDFLSNTGSRKRQDHVLAGWQEEEMKIEMKGKFFFYFFVQVSLYLLHSLSDKCPFIY